MKTKDAVNLFIGLQRRIEKLEKRAVLEDLQKELTPHWLEARDKYLTCFWLEVNVDWAFVIYAWDKMLFEWDVEEIMTWLKWYTTIQEEVIK